MHATTARRRALLVLAILGGTLTACSADAGEPGAARPAPTAAVRDAGAQPLGGDGEQVARPGVFPVADVVPLLGTLRQDPRGCWTLDVAGAERLVAMPPGSLLGDDRTTWTAADGTVVAADDDVEVEGAIVPAADVPDVPDGYWGNLLAFCAPPSDELVVIEAVAPASGPAPG